MVFGADLAVGRWHRLLHFVAVLGEQLVTRRAEEKMTGAKLWPLIVF